MNFTENDAIQLALDARIYGANGRYDFPEDFWLEKSHGTEKSPQEWKKFFISQVMNNINELVNKQEPSTDDWLKKMKMLNGKLSERDILVTLYKCSGSRKRCELILTNKCSKNQRKEWLWSEEQDKLILNNIQPKRNEEQLLALNTEKHPKWVAYRKMYLAQAKILNDKLARQQMF